MFTILSIILAFIMGFIPVVSATIKPAIVPWISGIGLLVLGLTPLIFILTLIPLQRAQQNQTTFVLDLLRKDRLLIIMTAGLILFSFLSILIFRGFASDSNSTYLAVWIVLFGIALDILWYLPRRFSLYFDSFGVIQRLSKEAKSSIANEHDEDLWQWMDAITEVATKSVHARNISLCNRALNELQLIINVFLASCKSLSRVPEAATVESTGTQDEISSTLFFLFDRFEIINEAAIHEAVTPVCSQLISTLGKITLACAKFDITLAPYPLHFLGKFALQAQEKNFNNVAVKASITLIEVAKAILTEIDITYLELQPTFLSLIAILDNIAKNTFKKDKTVSFKVLIQPFRDLKDFLQQEKFASQQDIPVIIRDLDRVINEFVTLETVVRTMPPISSITSNLGEAAQGTAPNPSPIQP